MRDNVYWINSAAIVRPETVYPLPYVNPAYTAAADLPTISLILPIPPRSEPRPFRCDCVEALDYPREKLDVCFISDGIPEMDLAAISHRVKEMVAGGMRARLVVHPTCRGQIAVLDEAIQSEDADMVLLADLMVPLPCDSMRKAASVHLEATSVPVPAA